MLTTERLENINRLSKLDTYPAILRKDINFTRYGKRFSLKKGHKGLLDLVNNIILINEYHIDIEKEEVILLYS